MTKPDPADLLEHGFSIKLGGPEVARLFFDELREQSKLRTNGYPKTRRAHTRSGQSLPVKDPQKRTPLVTVDDLLREFAIALAEAEVSKETADSWAPLVAQTRISRLEQGKSTSPSRQVRAIARWLVENRFRPVALVHEETSGSIFKARRRVRFEQFFDDIENDRVRDPLTGAPVGDIACFFYDRFTRDPDEGADWLRLLRRKGMNLHETYYGEEPKPLHLVEHDIRAAWNKAAKDVERDRERILNALEALAREGRPTYGQHHLFGHEAVERADEEAVGGKKVVGYRTIAKEAAAIRQGVENVLAGGSIYSFVCWLNENGFHNSNGGMFTFNQVERLLTTPRIAGLVRLRTDRARLQDENYLGELFPAELVYEDGGAPPPGYEPPIEPIIDYPMWQRVQDLLAGRKRKRGPRERYLASSFVECSECGDLLVAGGSGGRTSYRCPKGHLNGRGRPNADKRLKLAHDGKRHPTIKTETLDYILSELAFAAVDRALDAAAAPPAENREIERAQILTQIHALDERVGNISYMLSKNRITRSQYDEWTKEIDNERTALTKRLAELATESPQDLLPSETSLRNLWPEMEIERRREWIALIFDRIILRPATNVGGLGIVSRIGVTFRDGYAPAQEEVDALLAELERRVRAKAASAKRTPPEVEAKIVGLHERGLAPIEIRQALINEEVPPPKGGSWDKSFICMLLRRVFAERGETWVPNQRDRSRLATETRELIVRLNNELPSYAAIARELNKLGLRTVRGKDWSSHTVRDALATFTPGAATAPKEHRRRLPGALTDAMRETLWRMHREDGMSLGEIARWLNAQKIKTATGKQDWNASTILYIIRRVDDQKRDDTAPLAEAA